MATTRDYYDILGVARDASDDDIKRSFRKLAQQLASGRQHRSGCRRALQGDQRGLPGPVRSRSAARPTTCSAAPASAATAVEGYGPFGGFQGFGDIFDAFFGGNAQTGTRRTRRPAGADLRYDLRADVRRGRPRDREGDRVRRARRLPGLLGQRRRAGARSPTTCPQCSGIGRDPPGALDDARPDGQRHGLSALPRQRPDRRDAVPPLPGRGPPRAQEDAARDDPGRHRRGPPDPPQRRGRGRPARRHPRQPLRRDARGRAPGPQARRHRAVPGADALDHAGRARDGGADPHAGRRGAPRRSSPGTQPGTEIRRRGKGVAAPASTRAARRPPRAHRRRGPDPTLATASASCSRRWPPRRGSSTPRVHSPARMVRPLLGAHPEARADASVRSATASRTRSAEQPSRYRRHVGRRHLARAQRARRTPRRSRP